MTCQYCTAEIDYDKSKTEVICPYCDSTNHVQQKQEVIEPILLFAKRRQGYYYPATVVHVTEEEVTVRFLDDGKVDQVDLLHVLFLEDGFKRLNFQGNWKFHGIYYNGQIANYNPLIMNYNDGDTEVVKINQLRGYLTGEKPSLFQHFR